MSDAPPSSSSDHSHEDDAPEVLAYASPAEPEPRSNPEPLRLMTPAQERRLTILYAILLLAAILTGIVLMAWVSWSFASRVGMP